MGFMYICDVICENLPYGETNSVLLDQHVFVIVFMVEVAHGATKMFAVDVHEQ